MPDYVAMRPTLPGGVVTWLVTGFRTSFELASREPESASTMNLYGSSRDRTDLEVR